MTEKTNKINRNTLLIVTAIFIITSIATASWVYVQNNKLDFDKQELQQEKQLVEYEQEQINKRQDDQQFYQSVNR